MPPQELPDFGGPGKAFRAAERLCRERAAGVTPSNAFFERRSLQVLEKEAGVEAVAGAGGIDGRDGKRRSRKRALRGGRQHAVRAPLDEGHAGKAPQAVHGALEIGGAGDAQGLVLVGKKEIDRGSTCRMPESQTPEESWSGSSEVLMPAAFARRNSPGAPACMAGSR